MKRMPLLTPLQNAVLVEMENRTKARGNGTAISSSAVAESLGTRPQAVGATLNHLTNYGIVENVGRGMWLLTDQRVADHSASYQPPKKKSRPRRKPVEPIKPDFEVGDLLEFVGLAMNDERVVRALDTGRLFKIEPI